MTVTIHRTCPITHPADTVECPRCDGVGVEGIWEPVFDPASGEVMAVMGEGACPVCERRGWLTPDEHTSYITERTREWREAITSSAALRQVELAVLDRHEDAAADAAEEMFEAMREDW